ncbi:SDR family oxidoreductase [Microbacterium sp. ET2]|uniref:SDR family NAD(P)-dependent oxidoreductase n=1 Tax=Microbacterium albipurpureum TaxID=3050384 RepID=UPI00259CD220|nr:SDR family oxidoreductase [Microbacterium sp. ET2 (Ac-2212)]WJL96373.1 SDR family oxidoreductase [Microbacterium sp. ET2 (Ac-2212)]
MCAPDLIGRTVLVLGAAGAMGRSAARTLAGHGARVIVADEDVAQLEAVFGADDRFRVWDVDITDGSHVQRLAAEFDDTEVLIHCADRGYSAGVPIAAEHDLVDAFTAEVASCWAALRHFAPAMAARGRGSIIAYSGARAATGAERGTRAMSSEAINQMVREFAHELEPHGVRVNALAPAGDQDETALRFLASDVSRHVTGALVVIESGWSVIERIEESVGTR